MSLSEKANAIRELVQLVVSTLPKIVELILEICSLIREAKVNA